MVSSHDFDTLKTSLHQDTGVGMFFLLKDADLFTWALLVKLRAYGTIFSHHTEELGSQLLSR